MIGDAARVTQPGGTVSQHWPSYFLDGAEPTRVIDDVMQAFDAAGLTNLRVEFVTRDGSIELGSGTDFGALDPEAGWFRFSGKVADAPAAAATHAPGRADADARSRCRKARGRSRTTISGRHSTPRKPGRAITHTCRPKRCRMAPRSHRAT